MVIVISSIEIGSFPSLLDNRAKDRKFHMTKEGKIKHLVGMIDLFFFFLVELERVRNVSGMMMSFTFLSPRV